MGPNSRYSTNSSSDFSEPATSGSYKKYIISSSSDDNSEPVSKQSLSKTKSNSKFTTYDKVLSHRQQNLPKTDKIPIRFSLGTSKNKETVSSVVERMRQAIHTVNNDLSILSKSVAKLEFDFSVLNNLPSNSLQTEYTVDSFPVMPCAVGKFFEFENYKVAVPAQNANDVLVLNNILKNEKIFNEMVCICLCNC